jgi:predicted lipid-binding transport protein (Tim44 family)
MPSVLNRDLEDLKRNQQINRLENISVRRTDVTDSWNENGVDYSTVRFTANLLDYVVDEKTSQVVQGSDSSPVKFEEDWTFAKNPGTPNWQLVAIQQV